MRELVSVLFVCAVGAVLRLAFADRLGIEHFDEGVYASNLWFDADLGFRYPMRHLYAPPLLPAAIEWSLILTGLSQWAPFLPSLLAGIALAPSVWWIGRQWFGPVAGFASMTLAALSDVHAVFSRMALTDSLFVLFLAWGVYGAGETIRRGGGKMSVLAVAAATAAWWTKYNGWLALAIPIAAVVLFWLLNAPSRTQWKSTLAWIACLTIMTGLLWAPVVWGLQRFGGYGSVAENHGRYLTGVANWPSAALQQLANLRQLESISLSTGAPILALWMAGVVAASPRRSAAKASVQGRELAWLVGLAVAWSLTWHMAGGGVALGVAALGAIVTNLVRVRPTARPASLPQCLLTVWFVGLLFATPLYHPYARLTLPWLVAAWLGAGWAVSQAWQVITARIDAASATAAATSQAAESASRVDVRYWWALPVAGVIATFGMGLRSTFEDAPLAWQSHATTRQAAEQMATKLNLRDPVQPEIVLVYGEPALFYELRHTGSRYAVPLGEIGMALPIAADSRVPTWVAIGPHAEQDEAVQEWLATTAAKFKIEQFEFRPSTATLLDRYSPAELQGRAPDQPERFLLVPLP